MLRMHRGFSVFVTAARQQNIVSAMEPYFSLLCRQSGMRPAYDGWNGQVRLPSIQLSDPAVITPASKKKNNKQSEKGTNVSVSLCGGLPIRSAVSC